MNTLKFSQDFYRYFGREYKNKDILKVIFNQELRFNYFFRKYQNSNNKVLKLFYKIFIRQIRLKYGIEISPNTKIGKGFYIGHPFNITINPNVVLGENINIHKGTLKGNDFVVTFSDSSARKQFTIAIDAGHGGKIQEQLDLKNIMKRQLY